MASSNQWFFTESATGVNPDSQSYEYRNDLYFKTLNSDDGLYGYDNGGYTISSFDHIGVLDLNTVHGADASFTIEFQVKENGTIDTSKAINYLTFGYQIRGRKGVTITVGRDEGSKYVVCGTITEDSVDKALTMDTVKFETLPDVLYEYTLYYNHFGTEDEKLKLFRGYECIASSSSMETKSFSIIDRKLFIGSSAWVNEPSWESGFDYENNVTFVGEFNFYTNKAIDKGFLPGSIIYPVHWSLSNITNANRNNLHVATRNDTLEFKFHCLKEAPENTVVAFLDNRSNNITLMNVDPNHPRLDEEGNSILTSLYTFQLTVENEWPLDGFFSYGLNIDGSETLSNIVPPANNFYLDNSDANISFQLGQPSSSTIDVYFSQINDNYLTDLSLTSYENYSITFFASNLEHTVNTTINNSTITNGSLYTITNLNTESFYDIYATVRDPFGNTSTRILPQLGTNSTNIIETDDITKPNFELAPAPNSIYSVQLDTTQKPGIQLKYYAWDTATTLGHKYKTYIALFDNVAAQSGVNLASGTTSRSMDGSTTTTTTTINYRVFENKNVSGRDWTTFNQYTKNTSNDTQQEALDFLLSHDDVIIMVLASNGRYYYKNLKNNSSYNYDDVMNYLDLQASTANNYTTWVKDFGGVVTTTPTTTETPATEPPTTTTETTTGDTTTRSTTTTSTTTITYEFVVNNYLYQHLVERENSAKATDPYEVEFSQAFDSQGILQDIEQEKHYTFFVYLVDDAENIHYESHTHNIVNNVTFGSIVSDFAPDNNVARQGNTITLSFTTDYNMASSYLNVTMMGDSVTPVTQDGLNWTATKLITASHPSGPATYSVTQLPDINPISSFYQSSHTLYIQTVDASIVPGITFTSNLTDLRVNNLADFIDDFTINSNNNLVSLEFIVNSTSHFFNYTNKSQIQSVYTFPSLIVNQAYDISVSLSNVFTKSADIILGNVTTLSDIPIINLAFTNNDITTTSYPLVEIADTSFVTEHTTRFNLHVYFTDFNLTDPTSIKTFLSGTTPQITNNPTGENIGINTLMSSDITTFLSGSASSYISKNIIPSTTTTYYLYGLIDDTRTEPIYAKQTVTLDFEISQPTLNNTSYNYFVRSGDVVEMTWTTKYVSRASDFNNIKIFGVAASPSSIDGLNWKAEATVTSGTATHTISYLTTIVSVDASNVFYDNNAPTFDITVVSANINSFVVTLDNFGSDTYTDQVTPTGVSRLYTIDFNLVKVEDNSESTFSFSRDYANMTNNTFGLNELEEAKKYTITATLTDPANNQITISYSNGDTIQTNDTTIPIINSLELSITSNGANKVPGFSVNANSIDNNDYDLYLAVYNFQLSGSEDDKKSYIVSNHLSKDRLTTINTDIITTKELYKYLKSNDITQHDILTEEQYFVYFLAIDLNHNYAISNIVKTIDNTFTNTSVVTDFSGNNTIAKTGNKVIISFNTDYRVFESQLNVVVFGESGAPVSSDNGLSWTVTQTVTD